MKSYVLMCIRNQYICKYKTLLLSKAACMKFDLYFIVNSIFHKFISGWFMENL